MATTMLIVLMMEEIAVEIMSKLPTAQFVNAKKANVKHQYGKEIIIVMMATTILDVNMTEEIVVEMMSRPLTAKSVNVFNKMSSKNSRLTLGTRGKIRIFRINDRQIAGFSHCVKKCTM